MGVIDDLMERYRKMDPVQRQNFWYAVFGAILIALLLVSLSDSYESVRRFLGGGI